MSAVSAMPELLHITGADDSGQLRFVLPSVPRQLYPTGVQLACAACAKAGVRDTHGQPRRGMPYRFAGDPTPLCIPCWRGEERRRQRAADEELLARFWDTVGGVEVSATGDVLVAAVATAVCAVCGLAEPAPTCWLCSYTWLAQARREFAADLEFDAAEVAERLVAIEAVATAEARVAELAGWVERLRACLDAYGRPHPGSRGRPVELLADVMARDAADRSTLRGRPGALHRVAAVVAVDADWRTGRRALPGRARTAELAGCSERAVTSAWRRGEHLGWAVRTRQGRRLSLAERVELARSNDRAEFDLVQLYRSDVASELRAAWVPVALGVLGDVMDDAMTLLGAAEDELETARARYGTGTGWQDRVESAQRRRAVARVVDEVCALPAAMIHSTNIFSPRTASTGEDVSSGSYWGLRYSPIMIRSGNPPASAEGRAKTTGASRSPTEGAQRDHGGVGYRGGQGHEPHHLGHPRTDCGVRRRSRRVERPQWASWAYPLARELFRVWPWLTGSPLPWVAAALGAALGPEWTAAAVVDLVRTRCGPFAPAEDIHSPAAYLRELLRQALTGPIAPSYPARAHTAARRAVVAAYAEAAHAATAAAWTAADARAIAAVPATDSVAADALASLRARLPQGLRRPNRVAQLGPQTPAVDTEPAVEPWPDVAQPGAGLPHGLTG